MFLKNMEFFILILSILVLISTSSVYGCDVDNISGNNDGNFNLNALDSLAIENDASSNSLDKQYANGNIITETKILDNPTINKNIKNENFTSYSQTAEDSITYDHEENLSFENYHISASFDELDKKIQALRPGDVLNIDKDYYNTEYGKFVDFPITISTDNIIINGNGHIIDGRNLSAIFNVAGNNVKICNLTFINGDHHNSSYNRLNFSPISWAGDYGILSNCTFYGNKAIKGGAITWIGDYGLINNTLFENNFAYSLGGAIYLIGHDNTIANSIFINSASRIFREAIFSECSNGCTNFSNNAFDNETIPDDCLNSADFNRYYIDGSNIKINLNHMKDSHMTWVSDKEIDMIPVVYLFYNKDIMFFKEFNGTDFSLNFIRNLGDGLVYTKSYLFTNLSSLDDVFIKAMNGNYVVNSSLIKNIMVYNQNDYENAIKTTSFSLFYIGQVNPLNAQELLEKSVLNILKKDLASQSSNSIFKILNVNFAGQYLFNSKSTWSPSIKDFDMVIINGNGSTISVYSEDDDENKWADLNNESSILMVSNLKIEGFNTAIKNLGGACICNNMQFNNNRMDYWIEKDYGAGICNAGTCICTNCTFTNNFCKHGAGIFNQGHLEIVNCTFFNNHAYGEGDNICNANEGVVKINGTEIKGTQGYVVYVEGLNAAERSTLFTILSFSAMALAFGIGSLVGSPALGAALGALAGASVGALGGYLICSHVYDLNFNAVSAFTCIVIGCAIAGAAGGAFGSFIGSNFPCTYSSDAFLEDYVIIGPHGTIINLPPGL